MALYIYKCIIIKETITMFGQILFTLKLLKSSVVLDFFKAFENDFFSSNEIVVQIDLSKENLMCYFEVTGFEQHSLNILYFVIFIFNYDLIIVKKTISTI